MPEPSFDEFLISALQSLAARPVRNRKELEAWRVEAGRFEESFTPEQADAVPHFVWHYLGDADIRLRNAGYRADQERQLQQVLSELRLVAPAPSVRCAPSTTRRPARHRR